jgi:hypothetical protein
VTIAVNVDPRESDRRYCRWTILSAVTRLKDAAASRATAMAAGDQQHLWQHARGDGDLLAAEGVLAARTA